MNPAIVIPCYNRVHALSRLCKSLSSASYPEGEIPLVFSIDNSGKNDVGDFAKSFEWTHGPKVIIKHEQNIGLRRNILSCGDLTKEYGSVIVLEDDLIVSPQFYNYAVSALSFYENEERIAGISLYSYEYSEISTAKFRPLDNGSDCYFMAFPSSWGQAWTKRQWLGFKEWYDRKHKDGLESYNIPQVIKRWPETSWKKYFCAYLMDVKKYFVYPLKSFTYQSGMEGTHHKGNVKYKGALQVFDRQYVLRSFSESPVKYDGYFQVEAESLKKVVPSLRDYDFYVDFYGLKNPDEQKEKFVLTYNRSQLSQISFSNELVPPEVNVIMEKPGKEISIVPKCNGRFKEDALWLIRNEEFITGRGALKILLQKFKSVIKSKLS